MRFTITKRKYPEIGDTRTIHKFLFLPCRIGDEVRWLEKAAIEQKCMTWTDVDEMGIYEVYGWRNIAFI